MVSNQTIEGANQTLKDGNYPDVISFSNGINVAKMSEIKVEKQSKEGKISNTQYAVTWCMGGYVLIANPNLVSSFENLKEIDHLLVSPRRKAYNLNNSEFRIQDSELGVMNSGFLFLDD